MEIELNEYSSTLKMNEIKDRLNTLRKNIEETKYQVLEDIRIAKKSTLMYEDNTWNDEIGHKISDANNNVITFGINKIEKSLAEGNCVVLINKIDECIKSIDNTIREKTDLDNLKSQEGMEYNLDYIRQLPIKENSFKDSINRSNELLQELREIKI